MNRFYQSLNFNLHPNILLIKLFKPKMKKHTNSIRKTSLALLICAVLASAGSMSSCHKTNNNNNSTADSCIFLFHLHTQIIDSTIGGNSDGMMGGIDSNTTGSMNPWYLDGLNRRIELFIPQFFISNIMLVKSGGGMLTLNNVVLLKGLDSEDYYLCKVPTGTYVSAMFTVGLANSDSNMSPTMMDFITNTNLTGSLLTYNQAFPLEGTMWNGTDYYGMKITGAYDTSAAGTGLNPVPFTFNIPNSLTIAHTISLPTRGTAAANNYPVYVATSGSVNYIHILCDYGKLLTAIVNLKTNNNTNTNPTLADSLANNLTNMFRYEQ